MELEAKEIFVVAYDTFPLYVSDDKKEAKKFCKDNNKRFPKLNTKMYDLIEFGMFCYNNGSDDNY